MNENILVNRLLVFTDENGKFGNPVGIIVDDKHEVNLRERQVIAVKLGFSETVFINNLKTGEVMIFNPQGDEDFSGYALVGASYFLNKILGQLTDELKCVGNPVETWEENDITWIRASLTNTPPWHIEQLENADAVSRLIVGRTTPKDHTIVWAWMDQDKGLIRARTFAPDWGIPEDEANGSGSMQLAKKLGRSLEIHHGKGSVIYARPAGKNTAEVGGRTREGVKKKVTA